MSIDRNPSSAVLTHWGNTLRSARESARLTQAELGRLASLRRQKIIEIEQGKPGVATASYEAAARALGLTFAAVPAVVAIHEFPQLRLIAWNRKDDSIGERDALALYERNWSHIDPSRFDANERALLDRLVKVHGHGVLHV